MEENVVRKTTFVKIYEHILKKQFHVSDERIDKIKRYYDSYLDKFEDSIINYIVNEEEENINEYYDLFNQNVQKLFLHHFSKMIKETTYGYDPELAYNASELTDFLNIGIEYTYLIFKSYRFNSAEVTGKLRAKLEREVDDKTFEKMINNVNDYMSSAINQHVYFKENVTNSLNTIKEALGNEKIREIYDYNLRTIDNYELRDIEFNFDLHSPSYDNIMYYEEKKDITFFKYDGMIFKAFGQYESFDEFLSLNEEFKNSLNDYLFASDCASRNPLGFCKYKAENGFYYYLINGLHYKSEVSFEDNEIRQQFDRVSNFLTRVPNIKDVIFGNIYMIDFRENRNIEKLDQIRNFTKENIGTILSDINIYQRGRNENTKNATFIRLKEMYRAYETATNEKLSKLTGWSLFKKFFVYLPYKWSISSLKSDIRSALHMSESEFNQKISIENTTKFNTSSYDVLKNHQDLVRNVAKNMEGTFTLAKYLTPDVKEELNITSDQISRLKNKISNNLISDDIKEYEFNDDLDLDVFDFHNELKNESNAINLEEDVEFDDFVKGLDDNTSLDDIDIDINKTKIYDNPYRLTIKDYNMDLVESFDRVFEYKPNISFIRHYSMYIYTDLCSKEINVNRTESYNLAVALYNKVLNGQMDHMKLTKDEEKYVNSIANLIEEKKKEVDTQKLNVINDNDEEIEENDSELNSLVNAINNPNNLELKTYTAKLIPIGHIDDRNVRLYNSFFNGIKANEFVTHYTKYIYEYRYSLGRHIDITKAYTIASYIDQEINGVVNLNLVYNSDIKDIAKPLVEKISENIEKTTGGIKNIVVEEIKNDNKINDISNINKESKELKNEKHSKK